MPRPGGVQSGKRGGSPAPSVTGPAWAPAALYSALGITCVGIGYGIYKMMQASVQRASPEAHTENPRACGTRCPATVRETLARNVVGEGTPSRAVMQAPPEAARVFKSIKGDVGDRFRLVGFLGQGLTSFVFLVQESVPGVGSATRALKVIPKAGRAQEGDHLLELVRQETAVLSSLNHRHVIKVYDWLETPAHVVIVMEHAAGGELYDSIVEHQKTGGYTEETVRRVLQQVIAAVQYVHAHGVLHRDIKPENILLTTTNLERADVKLCDFGLAKLFTRALERSSGVDEGAIPPPLAPAKAPLTRASTMCGSENYVAPEVSTGAYGKECDLFSVGVVAFAMLSGSLPDDDDILEASGIQGGATDVHYRQWCVGRQPHPLPEPSQHLAQVSGVQREGSSRCVMDVPPFRPEALFEREARWDAVSPGAKDLVARLLRVDPRWRITAQEALEHAWLAAESWAEAAASGSRRSRHGISRQRKSPALSPALSPSLASRGGGSGAAAPPPLSLGDGALKPGAPSSPATLSFPDGAITEHVAVRRIPQTPAT